MKLLFNKNISHENCSLFEFPCLCFRMPFLKHTLYHQAKFFKIPLSQLPNFLFTLHQMSIHLRLEAMHHWKHLTGQPQLTFLPSTQTSSVKSSSAHFFPHLANIWRSHIEFLSLHVSNPSFLGFLECAPINFTSKSMNRF